MKKTFLFLAALAMSAVMWAAEQTLTFDLSSNPGSWPTANSTTLTDYTYTLEGVDYTFSLKNVKCNKGYTMFTATAVMGLPAIEGYKLTKVVASNSSGCSTSVKVGISSSSASANYISGGAIQTWATQSSSYTYELDETSDNTVYYLYVTNKNAQVTELELTYTDGTTPTVTLDSLVIKGTAEKMEYEVGETFDPAGLEVWGYYTKTVKHDSTSQITNGITWSIDPETFAEVSENASVTLSASYKELTTADTTITGIKVKAVVPKMDVAFNFTTNLYGHTGVSSGSGDSYVSAGDIAVGEIFNEAPAQIEFTVNGSTQTRFWDASSKHELRLYNGATFVLSLVGDYKIIKVEFTGSAVNLVGNGVTVSDKVWEGDAAKSVTFVNTTTTSKINSIKVIYIAANPAAANPTITPDTVANVYWEPITVTLACETEGADIYYTLDGSEPTALATKYTAPFSVSATTTVKAIAIMSGLDNSEVVSKTFTFGTVFASLEELLANQPATEDVAYVQVTITNAVIDSFYVSSKGYTNGVYVTASSTVVELYTNDVPETWEAGGKVSGTIKAEWLLYKGTPELQKWDGAWEAFTYTDPSESTAIQEIMIQDGIRKAMYNGHIYILRDGVMYDITGHVVK